jgi:hypothetical protein
MKFILQHAKGAPATYHIEVGQSMMLKPGEYFRLASESMVDGCIDLRNRHGHPCRVRAMWSQQANGFILDLTTLVSVPFLPAELRNAEEVEEVAKVIFMVPLDMNAVEGVIPAGQVANG